MTLEEFRESAAAAHLAAGGNEADLVIAHRPHRDGDDLFFAIDLAEFRAMELDELEDELEAMQDELDEIVEAIEEFEAEHGTLFVLGSERYDEYETLLDERFGMEVQIREVMKFLP
ncbi:MAG: hypothetical protein IKV35_06405 [Clostridia bacterium]|nr:hypothetical protein [Clostridia bacterium]